MQIFFFLMIRRPPRSTLFPTRRSSDLEQVEARVEHREGHQLLFSDLVRLQLRDRKSTRLNSSHSQISYAVFCLKKKNRIILYLHAHEGLEQRLKRVAGRNTTPPVPVVL